ncbi:alpha/beta hydrolase [Nocardia uniformis]|uniref:Alpha/beta hydrolase n=1 Tax=Nocardia uniformis TaxID=53432 RepID=A0A849C7L0_9NOCA|nr:alpha/beta hydrolase [Nocardia uniformis]NNH74654.1 alpha/beta hydrolase [Nocardia uniformis]
MTRTMASPRPHKAARAISALLLTMGIAVSAAGGTATADDPAPGVTAQSVFHAEGPHAVATSVRTNPCQDSVFGMVQHIVVHAFGNRDDLTCTQAFPNGLESPIGVNTYYPADIADMSSAPLIVLVPGIHANPGMYDAMARQWVSHGFVVVVPYDFFNSLAYVPALGVASAVLADRDPNSPLHNRIDLGRTIFAGHSAGGQAALQAGTIFPGIAALIDPTMQITGILAIEPGPLAIGALINVPTLFLTGSDDFVVPDFAWVRWWQYNLTFNAPAWIANARGVSHFSPVDGLDNYRSAGTAVAWLRYLAFDDETAKRFFVGPDWLLPMDDTYVSVERNAHANSMQG